MGTEYYIVKPDKKEIFYLGKHFSGFEGINTFHFKPEADYPDYEDFDDFFWLTLRENWDYFRDCDITLSEVYLIIAEIHDWCFCEKVYLDNDCSDNAKNWLNWQETGSIINLLEKVHSNFDTSS